MTAYVEQPLIRIYFSYIKLFIKIEVSSVAEQNLLVRRLVDLVHANGYPLVSCLCALGLYLLLLRYVCCNYADASASFLLLYNKSFLRLAFEFGCFSELGLHF